MLICINTKLRVSFLKIHIDFGEVKLYSTKSVTYTTTTHVNVTQIVEACFYQKQQMMFIKEASATPDHLYGMMYQRCWNVLNHQLSRLLIIVTYSALIVVYNNTFVYFFSQSKSLHVPPASSESTASLICTLNRTLILFIYCFIWCLLHISVFDCHKSSAYSMLMLCFFAPNKNKYWIKLTKTSLNCMSYKCYMLESFGRLNYN